MIHSALRRSLLTLLPATVLLTGVAAPAVANPSTRIDYPSGASATHYTGLGFDTCTAPSLSKLRAWKSSPYRLVNVYFGGINRGCKQPELSASWISKATKMGWRILPTYMGRQPTCINGNKTYHFTLKTATLHGRLDASDAVKKAKALGMVPGSALYADIEHYDRRKSSCATSVLRYISAWTETLHDAGYISGVYVHRNSGLKDLAKTYNSSSYARPDAVWVAHWNNDKSLSGWGTHLRNKWSVHQRLKQYKGDHDETWGGSTINIDSDSLNAPVATVAKRYRVTSKSSLRGRSGPGTNYSSTHGFASGSTVPVVCQAEGQKIEGTVVWNQLANGAWVSDRYVSTPSNRTFSSGIPRCVFPAQVRTSSSLRIRSKPGLSHPVRGSLPGGSLAWVVCQRGGAKVGGSRVWNQLMDGGWVSDAYVSTKSRSSWSKPIPRCK